MAGPIPFTRSQRLQRAEGTEGIPVGDDPVGERRPDPRKRIDLALGGMVEIDGLDVPRRAPTTPTNRRFRA